MTGSAPGLRRVVWAVLWLAVFSALYSAGEQFGIWPELPPGALRDLDLVVGAIVVAALVVALLLSRRGPA
jgi:hypothetical protein